MNFSKYKLITPINALAILAILLSATIRELTGQQYVHAAPEGAYVILGTTFAKDFTYQVSKRSTGESDFQILASVKAPTSETEFKTKLNENSNYFTYLHPVSDEAADTYWDYFPDHSESDSLFNLDPALTYLAFGIAFLDTTVQLNQTYEYQVERVRNGSSVQTDIYPPFQYSPPSPVSSLTLHTSSYDGYTNLMKWILNEKLGLQTYIAFRRDNLEGEYTRLPIQVKYTNRNDTTFALLQDTLIEEHQVYEYVLAPVDLFGNLGQGSEVVNLTTFSDYDFPYLQQFDAVSTDNREVVVTWKFEQKPFIRSIKLMRSMVFDSGFVQIAELPPTDTTYIDHLAVAMENYYYRLILNGPLNVSKMTVATRGRYLETSTPEPPVNVIGTGLDNGVSIEWDDLQSITLGFYVYRQNIATGEMEQISDIILIDTSRHYRYIDTTAFLRGDLFYRYAVQTVNDGYQKSDLSDTISVRPLIPTEIDMPTGFRLRKDKNSCYLFWDDISKSEINLDHYNLYRKRTDENEFSVLAEIPASRNNYLDTSIVMGYGYEYWIAAVDIFGSVSQSSPIKSEQWYLLAPPPPTRPRISKDGDNIVVRWNEVRQDGIQSYNIYKYAAGQEPELISNIPNGTFKYVDSNVGDGTLYFYYLTTVNDEDIESSPGKTSSVRN